MIVKMKAPVGVRKVNYGGAQMLVDDTGSIDVPGYVAKALVEHGFTGALSKYDDSKPFEGCADFELNYLFHAHGVALATMNAPDVLQRYGLPKISVE